MKHKRAKAYRKLMALYCQSFQFRQPYQVLIDSEFCKAAITMNIDLAQQLNVVLRGITKPMITQCCIHELYLSGKSHQQTVDLAKTFERRKCNHREAIPGDECLLSVVGPSNKHRYVVASMSQPLRAKLRAIPAVPLVHINRSVIVLEPPSDATLRSKIQAEEQVLHPEYLIAASKPTESAPVKRRKRPKGPNPLSVKKKRKPSVAQSTVTKTVERNVTKQEESAAGAHVGGKRKREDDHEEIPYSKRDGEEGETHTRRRKRKRTTKVVAP